MLFWTQFYLFIVYWTSLMQTNATLRVGYERVGLGVALNDGD